MRKITLLLLGVYCFFNATAQNPATTFTIANRTIILPCGTTCTSLTAQVPHIKTTNSYVVTNPAYVPFPYTTPTGTVVSAIYVDDTWSQVINLPFPFCFYGNQFNALLMGSNSAITFDVQRAGTGSGYIINVGGAIPSTSYAPNMIFGPYHDIDPSLTSANKKIEWRVEGTIPKRRFIASYNDMPYFGSSCTAQRATHEMVLYEGTGIVEVYIHDKPFCTGWNNGNAILGMQNQTQNAAIAANGKNATVWGSAGMDSCFRFIPSAGVSKFVSAGIYVNGTFIASADTSTAASGVLNLNWPNVCPTADSTAYELRVAFSPCGTSEGNVVFSDTIYVKKSSAPVIATAKTDANCSTNGTITVTVTSGTGPYEYSINGGTTYQSSNIFNNVVPGTYNVTARTVGSTCPATPQQVVVSLVNTLAMTVAKVDATCTGGSITVTATAGSQPYQYSINGGTTYQSSNTFTGLAAGTYNVMVKDAANCTRSQQVTLTFTNNLAVGNSVSANICLGASFTPQLTGNAATYSWTPTTGVSNATVLNPVFTPQATTTYTLTATLGTCTTQRTVTIGVSPGATANAGPDAILIAGDTYQMQGTGSAGTYLWTPSTALSATNILNPNATPAVTTTYTLRVTTGQGCFATDDVTLTVIPYCVKVMEAFTPNGDGINERWLITNGNCLQKAKAQVYNRYGSAVFESDDYKNTWDGTYKGKPLPDGTYYYVISFQLLNGKQVYLKGNVTILR